MRNLRNLITFGLFFVIPLLAWNKRLSPHLLNSERKKMYFKPFYGHLQVNENQNIFLIILYRVHIYELLP